MNAFCIVLVDISVARALVTLTHERRNPEASTIALPWQGRYYSTMHNGWPSAIFQEHYRTCVHNPEGMLAREAVSCRRPSADQPGRSLNQSDRMNGGYMVPCNVDSDCRVCPTHFLSNLPYVCMTTYNLYDYMNTYDHRPPEFINETTPLGLVAHTHFDPSRTKEDEVGDQYTGVCVDYHYEWQYTCGSEVAADVTQAAVQCFDSGREWLFCGVPIDRRGGDYSTVSMDWLGILEFPRQITPDLHCFIPFECMDICHKLRMQNIAPPACSFCDTPVCASPDCPFEPDAIQFIDTLCSRRSVRSICSTW